MAAPRRIYLDGVRVDLAQQVGLRALVTHDFGDQCHVVGDQEQQIAVTHQFDAPVAADIFADFDDDV
jgi:hypothetical protein